MRQVITRQPVMVGNTKIGDKEMVITTPVTEVTLSYPHNFGSRYFIHAWFVLLEIGNNLYASLCHIDNSSK